LPHVLDEILAFFDFSWADARSLVTLGKAIQLGTAPWYSSLVKQLGIALANNMHFRGLSKQIALRVCFIQKLIQDGFLNVKQCPTAVQTADIGTKALPQLYGSASRRQARWRQMIRHSALPKPRVSAFKFDLVCSGRLLSILKILVVLCVCMVAHCRPFGF